MEENILMISLTITSNLKEFFGSIYYSYSLGKWKNYTIFNKIISILFREKISIFFKQKECR